MDGCLIIESLLHNQQKGEVQLEQCNLQLDVKEFRHAPKAEIEEVLQKLLSKASCTGTHRAYIRAENHSSKAADFTWMKVTGIIKKEGAPEIGISVRIQGSDCNWAISLMLGMAVGFPQVLSVNLKGHAEIFKREAEKSAAEALGDTKAVVLDAKAANEEIARLRQQLAEKQVQLDQAEQAWETAESAVLDRQQTVESLRQENLRLANEKAELEQKAAQTKSAKTQQSKEVQLLTEELATCKILLGALAEVACQRRIPFEKVLKASRVKEQLVSALKVMSKELSETTARVSELEMRNQALQQELSKKATESAEVIGLKRQNTALKRQLKKTEQDRLLIAEQISAQTKELERMNEQLENLKGLTQDLLQRKGGADLLAKATIPPKGKKTQTSLH